MESIIQLRQMMAEERFVEVQRLIEAELSLQNNSHRHELIQIYLECLTLQDKSFPISLHLELCELELQKKNDEQVLELLDVITSHDKKKYYSKIQKIRAEVLDRKGLVNELYLLVVQYLHYLFQYQIPAVPQWVEETCAKFFKHDFAVKLHVLGLTLLKNNQHESERLTKELILSCFEKSSPKRINEKLSSIGEVLQSISGKGYVEIYQNFITISVNGIKDKSDYKKLVEMVILFDDFKFQTILLDLFDRLGLEEMAKSYGQVVKSNENYDFVYFDKYFQQLKKYFVLKEPTSKENTEVTEPDLSLEEEYSSEIFGSVMEFSESEEEGRLKFLVKHQNYSVDQLCDLAVGFLQSELPKVALMASDRALKESQDDKGRLKASYLKLTCLLQLEDYRAALDVCLSALDMAVTKDDILSFMYGEAEIYIRLENYHQAKIILTKILAIDSEYRLAKERLEKLNEI